MAAETWLMGLDAFSTQWKSLPWFVKHVQSLPPRVFVYVMAVASISDEEIDTTFVFIQIHHRDEKDIQYAQLVELKETGIQVLKRYDDTQVGNEDLDIVELVPQTDRIIVNREFSHRFNRPMRKEQTEVPR